MFGYHLPDWLSWWGQGRDVVVITKSSPLFHFFAFLVISESALSIEAHVAVSGGESAATREPWRSEFAILKLVIISPLSYVEMDHADKRSWWEVSHD